VGTDPEKIMLQRFKKSIEDLKADFYPEFDGETSLKFLTDSDVQ